MGFIRFILALSVLVGHSDHSFGILLLDTTVSVRSFYIISGFYMALVLNTKYREKPYYVFLRSRYLRLFPAYLITLLLTCIYGYAVYRIRGTVEWPFQGWSRTISDLSISSIAVLTLSNVFIFGQDILTYLDFNDTGNMFLNIGDHHSGGMFGGYMLISQAWTLGIEFMFYIIAPFIVLRSNALVIILMLASLSFKFILFPLLGIPYQALGYRFFPFELVYFLLGVISYRLYLYVQLKAIPGISKLFLAATLFSLYALPQLDIPLWTRYLSFTICMVFVFSMSKNSKMDRLIGELSYPMYITHLLVFYILTQFTAWSTEGAGSIITILLSFLMYYIVDKTLDRWRETLPEVSSRRFPSMNTVIVCLFILCLSLAIPLSLRQIAQSRHLEHSLALEELNLLEKNPAELITVGLEPTEANVADRWRWGFGDKSELIFSLRYPENFILTFEYASLPPHQVVSVYFNDIFIETITSDHSETVYRQYTLPGRKEDNVIRFNYLDWNGKQVSYSPNDSRPLAVSFTNLGISKEHLAHSWN